MQFSTREGISNEWRMRPATTRTRRMRVPGHATLDQDRAAAVPGERVRKLGGMHYCPYSGSTTQGRNTFSEEYQPAPQDRQDG